MMVLSWKNASFSNPRGVVGMHPRWLYQSVVYSRGSRGVDWGRRWGVNDTTSAMTNTRGGGGGGDG